MAGTGPASDIGPWNTTSVSNDGRRRESWKSNKNNCLQNEDHIFQFSWKNKHKVQEPFNESSDYKTSTNSFKMNNSKFYLKIEFKIANHPPLRILA